MGQYDELQYQSFPDAPGLVDSEAKLRAFELPKLDGKRFLDIGCNEGFNCGAALAGGACRVVGLDAYPSFIERARKRYPEAEFLLQTWDKLPDEEFDVILFTSAMHYIKEEIDVVNLLARIKNIMCSDSVLIIETGISRHDRGWQEIERSDGSKVYYPSMDAFIKVIEQAGLVHRQIGLSEPGDGIDRFVFHCFKYYTPIIFVLGPSNIGKTRLCYSLFSPDSDNLIYIDILMIQLYNKIYPKSPIELNKFNSMDVIFARLGREAVEIVSGFIYNEIRARIDSISRSDKPRSAIVIDGMNQECDFHKMVINIIVARLSPLHPMWFANKFQMPSAFF